MAIHSVGYTYFDDDASSHDAISTPRTLTSDPVRGLLIPKSVVQDFRMHLENVYPELAEKPFCSTRLCWYETFFGVHGSQNLIVSRYNDSPDGNWVIGRYPMDDSLIIATAGNGHAYKVPDPLEFGCSKIV
jgi:sarcosine oxidase/L-pipecolate oxidase